MKYAHSSDRARGVLNPQLYSEHVINVYNESRAYLTDAWGQSKMAKEKVDFATDVLSLASYYHDIGKLDDSSQAILGGDYSDDHDEKMLNHVDAGVAILLKKYEETKNLAYLMAAFLVHAHHLGLGNQNPMAMECLDKTNKHRATYLYKINERLFRDNRDALETYGIGKDGMTVREYVNGHLEDYEKIHEQEMGADDTYRTVFDHRKVGGQLTPITNITRRIPLTALQIRMIFSCLVDADHTDTDRFYSQQYGIYTFNPLQADKRMVLLQEHIKNLPRDPEASPERLKSRRDFHATCLNGVIPDDISFFALDGSVGIGKTFSGATYALRLVQQRNAERFYNIIPFTNIISQTVKEYRSAMLFPNEDENNINEIHSKCEFDKIWMRKYSNRWNAPINVSTAVQFYESLVSNKPSKCRKLHWFANSVFFFDEFDKSMPHEYWQYILPLLKQLAYDFNCSFIFSSGTSAYYWDIFEDTEVVVHDIVDRATYGALQNLESKRIRIEILPDAIADENAFVRGIWTKLQSVRSGLIVCNTIKNACVLADMMLGNTYGYDVYELTGWQTPEHRERILDRIRNELKDKTKKVLVVATSTIECGVDISFDVGWREKVGPLNLFQFNGRINRGSKSKDAVVYVFHFTDNLVGRGKLFSANPQLISGIEVFDSTDKNNLNPAHCTDLVRQELAKRMTGTGNTFMVMEENRQFQSIKDDFNIIDSATATVIVDKELIKQTRAGEKVPYNKIVRNSIQLWFTKIEQIQDCVAIHLITGFDDREYYVWEDEYDEQTGIGRVMLSL